MSTPNIVWKGSPNYFPNRQGVGAPIAICDHIMQGTMESSASWFAQSASQAAAHYGVARDGRVWQFVRDQDGAWANGIEQSPDMSVPWIADCVRSGVNPNDRTLSIEHEGVSGQLFTEEQYQATLWLHRYLCQKWHIKGDRQHIVGHYQITARDRANCPGPAFPWTRLMKDLGETIAPENTQNANIPSGAVAMDYQATIEKGVAVVRSGPGRMYQMIEKIWPNGDAQYHVVAEAHGEEIWGDDVWSYLAVQPGIEKAGYVTRTALKIIN